MRSCIVRRQSVGKDHLVAITLPEAQGCAAWGCDDQISGEGGNIGAVDSRRQILGKKTTSVGFVDERAGCDASQARVITLPAMRSALGPKLSLKSLES